VPQALLNLGDVCVDLERRLARHRDGRKLRLTPLEHRMLESFVRNPDRMVTHQQLMREVWGPNQADRCALRVYIASLRRKLECDPSVPKHIVTEIGAGYRLVVEANSATVAMQQ
jgi:two-component system, OmpR family, KDP operon response regulator KdpE